ncbi:prostaglandin D2 receptor 2-like [Brienomyrus brachyistius]|uniref:prostaglandin D2 receptor 2-like n=1 Tax=Brienomyrus brachyistius TaxID=42636 RepID=UPI0020B1CEB2|nr:prostaglandin D2 receptor 2-like [Brienomyrus brachyistius]
MNNSSSFCTVLESLRNSSNPNETNFGNMAVVVFHGICCTMGILENALILWVVGFRVRRTVAAVWVLNLALSDFLGVLTLPLFTYYLSSSHSWELGEPLCVAQSGLFFLNMFVSAFLLATISLDRCLLVMQPIWSKTHRSVAMARKICALGWLWAGINTLPYMLFRAVIPKTNNRSLCYHHFARFSTPETLEHDCQVRQVATALSKFLLAFLIPLSIIACSYACVSWKLRQRHLQRQNSLFTNRRIYSNSTSSTLSPRFSKMVMAVIAIFIFTWSPYHIFCLLEVTSSHRNVVEVGLPIAATFSFLNATLNPFLYAFSCPDFCERIRESMGAVLEGLLTEGEDTGSARLQFNGVRRSVTEKVRNIDNNSKTEIGS